MIVGKAQLLVLAAAGAALVATAAVAGDWVLGYGATRSAAMNDANGRAQVQAQAAGTCYRQAKGESCRQDQGEWVCRAEVTHHDRSRPGGVCPS